MRKKLLIIENESGALNVLKNLANQSNFECETESTGKTYLEKAKAFSPDAILMNLNTPQISGFGIIRNYRLQPELKNVPVIVYSQIEEPSVVEESLQLGANAYFNKSEDVEKVFDAIREYLSDEKAV